MSDIIELDENMHEEVSEGVILVDFYADWCQPCKMMMPSLETVASEFDGKARIGKVDIEKHQDLAKQHGISSIPTLFVFKNGEIVDRMIGLQSLEQIKNSLNKVV